MKRIILAATISLMLMSFDVKRVNTFSEADLKVYFTKNQSEADFIIYNDEEREFYYDCLAWTHTNNISQATMTYIEVRNISDADVVILLTDVASIRGRLRVSEKYRCW
jgi:hypothetical protein